MVEVAEHAASLRRRIYEDIAPISSPARQALERYLRAHPRLADARAQTSDTPGRQAAARQPLRCFANFLA